MEGDRRAWCDASVTFSAKKSILTATLSDSFFNQLLGFASIRPRLDLPHPYANCAGFLSDFPSMGILNGGQIAIRNAKQRISNLLVPPMLAQPRACAYTATNQRKARSGLIGLRKGTLSSCASLWGPSIDMRVSLGESRSCRLVLLMW